jgi:hypothetical protein
MKPTKPPTDSIDTDVLEAYDALAKRIPDGYFDDFSTRVLARLDHREGTDMEGRREIARGSGLVRPDEAALSAAGGRPPGRIDPPGPGADDEPDTAPVPKQSNENTGLHDIQSLASSTKRRISQRISAETEAQDSMLLSTSSGAMKTVALPDPAKESSPEVERERIAALRQSGQMKISRSTSLSKETPAVTPVTARERSGPAASFGAGIVEKDKSSAPWWILGGVAMLAAAAAVAFFVFDIGRKTEDTATETAAAGGTDGQVVASAEPAAAPPATATPAPTVQAIPDPGALPAGGAGSADEGGAAGAAVVAPLEDESDAKEDEPAHEEKSAEGDKDDAAKGKSKEPAAASKPADKAKKTIKVTGTDLEDVLNQVTGGVEAPKAEAEKKPAVPTKKALDRRDVDTAMGPVRGAAIKCSALEQFEGSVSVKFTVAPNGKVTAASTNKKGPTGDCVAKAVKSAKFPPFDGTPTSFTYPFLLAE